ncbi:MAG: ATP-grasp domain-containing protein [Pirellulales bacterium]|nr:ATP-grasp domain-containing protein [Pirellulales bacterium]
MQRPLIIVGASTRAASQSAIRAGFVPWQADCFGDVDLAACGSVRRIEPYPWGLLEIVREAPEAPWMYTGALENYPELIEQLASQRPLWGNSSAAVRQVRDPERLVENLNRAGFDVPRTQFTLDRTDQDRPWLQKQLRSAGGREVACPAWESLRDEVSASKGSYFQQQIVGQPVSAVYVASGTDAKLLGITGQLIGNDGSGQCWCTGDWTGATGFWYAGSIGPLTAPIWLRNRASEIGQCVARAFGLVGLFGIDAILTDDALRPIEVNPRYTASIEVLERAMAILAIELHVVSCERKRNAPLAGPIRKPTVEAVHRIVGKAVLYAQRDIDVPHDFSNWAADINSNRPWPTIADIPSAKSKIPRGWPICSVFAEADQFEETAIHLRQLAGQVYSRLDRDRV